MKKEVFYSQSMKDSIQWCIDQHRNTNHFYDKYLPYEFHLRMVAQVCENFYQDSGYPENNGILYLAAYGHDLIEDTRVSYNDVLKVLGKGAADIVYAVSNEKGKNRKERANDRYYDGIRGTEGAVFIKICDRIANVQYSKMTKSRMFDMYKNENELFMELVDAERYVSMKTYLINLFIEE